MDRDNQRIFVKWALSGSLLVGKTFKHRGLGTLGVVSDGEAGICFKDLVGKRFQFSSDFFTDEFLHQLSERDLKELEASWRQEVAKILNIAAAGQDRSEVVGAIPSIHVKDSECLRFQIDSCLDKIVTFPETQVAEILGNLVGCVFLAEYLLPFLRELRTNHPKGISNRPQRRRLMVEKIIQEITLAKKHWWQTIADWPFENLLTRLDELPEEHVDAALDRLLQIPASHMLTNQNKLWAFYIKHLSRILIRPKLGDAPSLAAFAAFLVSVKQNERARELLAFLSVKTSPLLESLVSYLQFVVKPCLDLSGSKSFSSLTEEDIFLGACYYSEEAAHSVFDELRQWDWKSVEKCLSKNERKFNDFKVRGLQPRVAELAFARIRDVLYSDHPESLLTDLNLQCIRALPKPWSGTHRKLPPADWRDGMGETFDVKCNTYFRSKRKNLGLRGLLVEPRKGEKDIYSGFIFVDASDVSCSWIYVGEYHPLPESNKNDRVLPFCFRLPDACRVTCNISDEQAALGELLLSSWPFLLDGWALATGRHGQSEQLNAGAAETLWDLFIEKAIQWSGSTYLEYGTWRSVTEVTLKACSEGLDTKIVSGFLAQAAKFLNCREIPVQFPRIDGTPLLCRWISEVLEPLVRYWDKILCPKCGGKNICLSVTQMTASGSIHGTINCKSCPADSETSVTILTHCYKCNCYPLIIGKNLTCPKCLGLVCSSSEIAESDTQCGSCKKGCEAGFMTESGIISDICTEL
jgi:hypothetical protein